MLIDAFDSRLVRVYDDCANVRIEILSIRGGGWVSLTPEQAIRLQKGLESAIRKALRTRTAIEKADEAEAKRTAKAK